ncbi:hypothetical protein GCM10029976_092880 [Kribbella albertanoniae]
MRAAGEVHDTEYQELRRRHAPTFRSICSDSLRLRARQGVVPTPTNTRVPSWSGWCQPDPQTVLVETSKAKLD